MKNYTWFDEPLKVFGIPFFYESRTYERLPADLREQVPSLKAHGRRCPGARIGFRTDAESFTVKMVLRTLKPDPGMSIFASQSIAVMAGERTTSRFLGVINPPNYETKTVEKRFYKGKGMEEVTLWMPRNEILDMVEVSLPDEARIEPPTPYRYGKAVFYGSSITAGGCAATVTNGHVARLSRLLDLDFYNLGFPGSARGEIEIADYINTLDMQLFILDYDHNAPTPEHLANTHEAFFRRIREKHPTIPVLFLTRPDFEQTEETAARRAVVRATYERARAAGDENVYYLDGEAYFEKVDRQLCSVDGIHPNDLGFYFMAEAILPVMKDMLESIS